MKALPKPKNGQEWLKLATSKDDARPALQEVYGNIASDGVVMFVDNNEPAGEIPSYNYLPILEGARKNNTAVVTVDRDSLLQAMKQARVIANQRNGAVQLYVDGRLYWHSEAAWLGETTGYIADGFKQRISVKHTKGGDKETYLVSHYTHQGKNMLIAANCEYIYKAACGMGETVTMALEGPEKTIYMTDGTKEAVVMPMRIEAES